ncbi:NAD-P-binding protein [Rickenella mellea]|uniref:NAD-P-binding protein n=1 Tax=Rickenella mellea TaxID=50990 RepID=A0A4Y7QAN4_9AGAM|nr:NAD-P-binding protein [Rickenella mellea]
MTFLLAIVVAFPLLVYLAYLYCARNDECLSTLPPRALVHSPNRWTTKEIQETFARLSKHPHSIVGKLPPKTGRRYIVVGGAGFLGGWLVFHLLARGEDPRRIRVLDIRRPTRLDLTTGKAANVDFRVVDVSDADAVNAAFDAPWPDSGSHLDGGGITVFHTAATIRFYERMRFLVPLSAKVNVSGTQNIITACQNIGVDILIYTSSGSISIRRTRFWLWPWQSEPDDFVQVIDDCDDMAPTKHEEFFSNYALTKRLAESLVRRADRSSTKNGGILRTGCLRPGNGIFGPGGDVLCGAYIVRKTNPTWIPNILQNFIYVENCSLAHLCYEARLAALSNQPHTNRTLPDIGGQAFCVADPNPPVTYGDVYHTLNVLTHGKTTFPIISPTLMLLISHMFELWYLIRHVLLSLPKATPLHVLGRILPPLGGDLVNLQPSLFALVVVHLVFDDSRARLPPEEGGLGYEGVWTTLEGLCKLVDEHEKNGGHVEERQKNGGGVSIGFGLVKAERGVEKVKEGFMDAPSTMMN